MITVKFKKLSDNALPFAYSRENDACMDMYAGKDTVVYTNQTVIVPTNIAVELPKDYEGIVRGRSGLASKGVYTHAGTIDESYRGNIGVIITNFNERPFIVKEGMRIAQFTIKSVYRIALEEVNELSETNRGSQGFGSSGL